MNVTKRPVSIIPADLESRLLEAFSAGGTPTPSPGMRARVMERAAQDVRNQEAIVTTRSHEDWTPFAPGVEAKVLNDDGKFQTWLARMSAGATLPAHHHDGDEECMVVEGSVLLGDVLLQTGDYQVARKGTSHGEIRSPKGCVLMLRSPSPQAA